MKLEKKLFEELNGYKNYTVDVIVENEKVGRVDIIVPPEEESKEVYIEMITINKDQRNKGYGSTALNMLAEEYGFIYMAPDDENNQRLYKRIGEEYTENTPEVDQGFGVYFIEK